MSYSGICPKCGGRYKVLDKGTTYVADCRNGCGQLAVISVNTNDLVDDLLRWLHDMVKETTQT